MKNKHFVYVLIAVALLSVLVIQGTSQDNALTGGVTASQEPIRIGFMTDLTGPAAPYGEQIRRGAQLALNEYNSPQDIQVHFEDTQCDPKTGLSILNKFRDLHNIQLTGGTVCSSVALAIAPTLTDSLHISTGASSPQLTRAGENFFRLWPSDDFEAQELARYALQERDIQTASILYVNTEYGAPLKEAFKLTFNKHGATILGEESFTSEDKEFRSQLTKIRQQQPQAIYIVSEPSQLPLILSQIREFGIDSLLLSYGPPVEAEGVLQAAGVSSEGIIYAHPDQQESAAFQQRYQAEYATRPGLGASVGYDTMKLLLDAVDSCETDDVTCVKKFLEEIDAYAGASGNISFDEYGDVHVPVAFKQVRGQTPTYLRG